MAIELLNSGGTNSGIGQTGTLSVTVSTGNRKILLVGFMLPSAGGSTPTSVTRDGQALTLISTANRLNDARVQIWALSNPNIGTADVTWTGGATIFRASYIVLAGAAIGATPVEELGTFAKASGSTAGSITGDAVAGDWIFDVYCTDSDGGSDASITGFTPGTPLISGVASSPEGRWISSYRGPVPSDGSVTVGVSYGSIANPASVGAAVLIHAATDATGTAALLSDTSHIFFDPTATAGTTGTTQLLEDPNETFFAPTASVTVKKWFNQAKSAVTWTNQSKS